jgi:hypothetical protein
MAKFVRVTDAGVAALDGLKGQSKELLAYIVKKYGANTDVDQSKLVLDLNSHQFDTEVLSKQSSSPISRLYEFYRSKTWAKEGWVTVTTENKGVKTGTAAKWQKLQADHQKLVAHAAYLEELLEKNNIEYDQLDVEDEPEDVDEETAEDSKTI